MKEAKKFYQHLQGIGSMAEACGLNLTLNSQILLTIYDEHDQLKKIKVYPYSEDGIENLEKKVCRTYEANRAELEPEYKALIAVGSSVGLIIQIDDAGVLAKSVNGDIDGLFRYTRPHLRKLTEIIGDRIISPTVTAKAVRRSNEIYDRIFDEAYLMTIRTLVGRKIERFV